MEADVGRQYPVYPMAMDEILDRCEARRAERRPFTDLCIGASQFDVSPYVDLALGPSALHGSFGYGDVSGRIELRRALSRLYADTLGVDIDPERFIVTDGASGALIVALTAVMAPGDELLLPEVCFPVYKIVAHMLGVRCVFVPLDDQGRLRLDEAARLIGPRTRAIVVNSPSNPLGATASRAELEALTGLGVEVISDEVYGLLGYDGPAPSLMQVTDRHFVVSSLSKAFAAAGFRIGYAIVPERLLVMSRTIKATLNVCTSVPSQILAERLIDAHATILREHRRFLRDGRDRFVAGCARHQLHAHHAPQAGFFGLVELGPRSGSSLDAARSLIDEHDVAVCPSIDFAPTDPRYLRVNFSSPPAALETGLERLAMMLAR